MCDITNASGLAGENAIENTELFSIVDAAADAWVKVYEAIFHEKDEARKVSLCIPTY